MTYTEHYSVLKKECLDLLYEGISDDPSYRPLFADCTFGGGGHSLAIVERDKRSSLISFDQDPDALRNGRELIAARNIGDRLHLVDSNFVHFEEVVKNQKAELLEGHGGLDGVLLDLGVSSHHFDAGDRGFSFRMEAPLDMRMDFDNDEIQTAKDIINNYSGEELSKIFYAFGEEKFTKKIVANILEKRLIAPIETTTELAELIRESYPAKLRYGKIHPATKCFQALRIEVNKELSVLTDVIPQIIPLLKKGGKLLVITFHSLEDRIVKHEFKNYELKEDGVLCEVVTKKPIIPSDEEIKENSRSRSAKLRVLRRIESKRVKSKNKYAQFSKIGEQE
ncbi:16S rRNA (cytosine(1402)-N(4))-methyltransferase RsmH [Bacteriovorax sp. Seq25_V]|uniref:16S rRNA (cytosine(1402)-N(4))-methyltransferase RsmH n=1 Tax=Bacteriovorax sp. Seq25_V TaxID=1201288 RepID=UPI00038A0202|nr:16S rRNA (cytosine(1402)-N(4))-methyltransferase RsmH [Bacteriovorax sp. Seq25_V]EQC43544.1 16S rRNA (cytosine(1402)-N(4))-methyltransferase [Bacteriovorax sp. Seq25_V]